MSKNHNPFVAYELDQIRRFQAARLWYLGVGTELGFDDLGEFQASIPPVRFKSSRRDGVVILVPDARVGVTKLCQLLGIEFNGDNQAFINQKSVPPGPYWINFGILPEGNRWVFSISAKRQTKLNVLELLSIYAQIPEEFRSCKWIARGSIHKYGKGEAVLRRNNESGIWELRYNEQSSRLA